MDGKSLQPELLVRKTLYISQGWTCLPSRIVSCQAIVRQKNMNYGLDYLARCEKESGDEFCLRDSEPPLSHFTPGHVIKSSSTCTLCSLVLFSWDLGTRH